MTWRRIRLGFGGGLGFTTLEIKDLGDFGCRDWHFRSLQV